MMPKDISGIDPVAFWEHSLGCALVCRHFARKIGFPDPSKAYGMPQACAELGILNRVVTLSQIPSQILQATRYRKRA